MIILNQKEESISVQRVNKMSCLTLYALHAIIIPSGFIVQYSLNGPQFIWKCQRLYFPKNIEFLSLKIDFVLANSEDPDEMQHYAESHLGLHCLAKMHIGVNSLTKGP